MILRVGDFCKDFLSWASSGFNPNNPILNAKSPRSLGKGPRKTMRRWLHGMESGRKYWIMERMHGKSGKVLARDAWVELRIVYESVNPA